MNELQLYFGDDYLITKYITLKHPKVDDIIRMGEEEYFAMINLFAITPSDMKPFLYDNFNIIWEDISDYECFLRFLWPQITSKQSHILFGDLDLTKFERGYNCLTEEPVLLYDFKEDSQMTRIVFDRLTYIKVSDAIRKIHGMKKNVETAGSKTVQKILIDYDRAQQQKEAAKKDKEGYSSSLLPLISSLVNCSDFKYGLNEIRQMPVYAFMDSVSRVQVVRNTTALLQGCYSGMIDTKKINKDELNFMRLIKK